MDLKGFLGCYGSFGSLETFGLPGYFESSGSFGSSGIFGIFWVLLGLQGPRVLWGYLGLLGRQRL